MDVIGRRWELESGKKWESLRDALAVRTPDVAREIAKELDGQGDPKQIEPLLINYRGYIVIPIENYSVPQRVFPRLRVSNYYLKLLYSLTNIK